VARWELEWWRMRRRVMRETEIGDEDFMTDILGAEFG